jgi:NADH-quinone oxidoreductase subunit N
VSFQQLLDALMSDTGQSLRSFLPELAICATLIVLLTTRLFGLTARISSFVLALLGTLAALYLAVYPWVGASSSWIAVPSEQHREIFTGMLVYDSFTIFFRALLLFFAVLFIVLTRLTGLADKEDGADFYVLLLGAILGMCLMASANHLLMVFLGVEMASVPSYAMAGLLKGRRASSEAALKYAVYGAGAAGVMLYGISLIAGLVGSAHLPTIAMRLADMFATGVASQSSAVLALGGLMIMVGMAFKLSAVPFHFWCPDVFEGATAEVNAFLSVASKAAALALLVRLVVGFSHVGPEPRRTAADAGPAASEIRLVSAAVDATGVSAKQPVFANRALAPVRSYLIGLICLLSAITCTFGNLAAYGQTNIKRLLAYSTIAHAGYLMMPVAAALVLLETRPDQSRAALGAMCFYIAAYVFMNLGAFAIIAFLRNAMGSEEIADYAGLVRRAPGLVICFVLLLLSLLGLPPLAGFAAKFVIFSALVDAAQEVPAYFPEMIGLLVIGGLNTAVSLYYYVRVAKVMVIDPEPENRLPLDFSLASLSGAYVVAVTAPVLVLGIWFNELIQLGGDAAAQLLP